MSERPPDEAPIDASVASDDADARAYRVKLPMFEGPLDLLLHLIQKHELNILDIPIGFVALKYVEYIRMMEEMSIDLASEYLVMAATLAHIKSRSLLPPDPTQETEEGAEEEEEDPRAELIRKLLEYQKYKHAADNLGQREVLGRDVFQRGIVTEQNDEEAPLAPMSLFKLVDAFESVLKRVKQVQEHQIDFEKVSISDRIGQIVERLRTLRTLQFEQLFDGDVTRAEMIVTFLALLEMTKLRMTRLTQEGPLAPIVVELVLSADQVHNFDAERAFEQVHHAVEQDFAADKPWSEQEPDPAAVEPLPWQENVEDLELSDEELAEELREAAEAFALGDLDSRRDPDVLPEPGDQLSTFGPPDEDDAFFDDADSTETGPGPAHPAAGETPAAPSDEEAATHRDDDEHGSESDASSAGAGLEPDGPPAGGGPSPETGSVDASAPPEAAEAGPPWEPDAVIDPELSEDATASVEPDADLVVGFAEVEVVVETAAVVVEPSAEPSEFESESGEFEREPPEYERESDEFVSEPPEYESEPGASEHETEEQSQATEEGSQDPKGSDVESP